MRANLLLFPANGHTVTALVAAGFMLALVEVSVELAMQEQLAHSKRKALSPWTTALWLPVEDRARLLSPRWRLCRGTRWHRRSARSSEKRQRLHRPPIIAMARAFVLRR
jgi:hypothetical protein